MNITRSQRLPLILAGVSSLVLSEICIASTVALSEARVVSPIVSAEQAVGMADLGLKLGDINHEVFFREPVRTIVEELSIALNGETLPASAPRTRPSSVGKKQMMYQLRSEDVARQFAKSLVAGILGAQAHQNTVNISVSCLHSGSYTITSVDSIGEVGSSVGSQRPRLIQMSYSNCIDYYVPEQNSISRNGVVLLTLQPLESGKYKVKQVQFGSNAGGPGFRETYTEVATQLVGSEWVANYAVSGDFMSVTYDDNGLPVGRETLNFNGGIYYFYQYTYAGQIYRPEFTIEAKSLNVARTFGSQMGPDRMPNTYDDLHEVTSHYKTGGFRVTGTGDVSFSEPVLIEYSFDNLVLVDKRAIWGPNRYQSVNGGLTYLFPYFTNPACLSGNYEFRTFDDVYYDQYIGSDYPIGGKMVINRSATISYGLDQEMGSAITSVVGAQSVTYYPAFQGVPSCY